MLAVTLLIFGGVFRSGEGTFTTEKPTEEELLKKPKGRHLTQLETGTLQLTLPFDKTNLWEGRTAAIAEYDLGTRSVLAKHFRLNNIDSETHIYSYVAGKGKRKGERFFIEKEKWGDWLKEQLRKTKQEKATGHSLRIGASTQMLLNGVDPLTVKAAGGWKSDTFLTYWRHVSALIDVGKLSHARAVPETVGLELREELVRRLRVLFLLSFLEN
jgi:hypothetical protein